MLLCKGRDVRLWRPSGVPWSPRLCASISCSRRTTCCSARGVMYASGVLWRPLVSTPLCFYFAWQARDLLLCKGRDVRLWRPSWAPRLCASISRGRPATCFSARGVMYASGIPLASLGLRASVLLFGVAGAATCCSARGVIYASRRPSWAPRLCASISCGRRAICWCARGVMYASGIPLASLGLRASVLLFGVAGAGFAALQGA